MAGSTWQTHATAPSGARGPVVAPTATLSSRLFRFLRESLVWPPGNYPGARGFNRFRRPNMTSMHKVTRLVVLTALVASGFVGRAEAAPIVFVDPTSQDGNIGDSFSVDIIVTGLTDPIGGF